MSNLLVFRFIITNVLLACLAGALWLQGYVWPVIEGGAPLTWGILGLFAVGWVWSFKEIIVISSGLNWNKHNGARAALLPEADKDIAKTEWLPCVAEWLVALGLLGTVIGFMGALEAVDQSSLGSAEGAKIGVGKLMGGMRVALTTTLLGAALALWHEVNCRLLKTGMAVYWSDRLASGQNSGD